MVTAQVPVRPRGALPLRDRLNLCRGCSWCTGVRSHEREGGCEAAARREAWETRQLANLYSGIGSEGLLLGLANDLTLVARGVVPLNEMPALLAALMRECRAIGATLPKYPHTP